MALETIGLGAVVKFDGQQAISGMRAVSQAASGMSSKVSQASARMSRGVTSAGGGMAMTGLAMAPLTAGLVAASSAAADFEQQMDAVGAVSRASASDQAALEKKAKDLGASTVFTATEAGKAMEELARMGFDAQQTIGASSGVVALAAADNMTLASSATTVATTLSAFHLEAGKANRVADVLAMTSARTGTNVSKLAEGLKFAAPNAQRLGVDLATTATMLGLVADTGIRGTLSGTAFKNALAKLVAPSKKGADLMKQYGIELATTADGSLDLVKTLDRVKTSFSGMTKVQKAAAAKELLGERGQPLLAAFEAGRAKKEDDGKGGEIDKVTKLMGELKTQFETGGAAAEMAERRLSNFKGSVILLTSALEGLSIETFSNFLPGGAEDLKMIAEFVQDVVFAMQILSGTMNATESDFAGLNKTAVGMAKGIAGAIKEINSMIERGKELLKGLADALGLGDAETIEKITKVAVMIGIIGGAVAPVLIALGGIAIIIGTVVLPAIEMIGAAFGGALGPILIVIAAWVGAFLFAVDSMGSGSETFGETVSRVWNGIVETTKVVIDKISGWWDSLMERLETPINWVKTSWNELMVNVGDETKQLIGTIIVAFETLEPFFDSLLQAIGRIFEYFGIGASGSISGIITVVGKLTGALLEVASIMVEVVMNSLIGMAKLIVKTADMLGAGGKIDPGLRAFSNEGLFKVSDMMARNAAEGFGAKKTGDPLADREAARQEMETTERLSAMNQVNMNRAAEGERKTEVNVKVDDHRVLDVNNCVKLDGRQVAANQAKHQQEVNERRGFKATPWQKRLIVEQGATVSTGM